MSDKSGSFGCTLGCWAMAAGAGLLTLILLLVLGDQGIVASIFLGGLVFVFLGLLFTWLFCSPISMLGGVGSTDTSRTRAVPHTSHKSGSSSHAAGAGAGSAAVGAAAAAGGSGAVAAGSGSGDAGSDAVGSAGSAAAMSGSADAGGDAAATGAATTAQDAAAGGANSATAAAAAAGGAAAATATIKPSQSLAGQQELAGRKGNWRYEGGDGAGAADATAKTAGSDADGSASAKGAATSAKTKPADQDTATDQGPDMVDRDNDGIIEGKNEGTKPQTLSAARDGGADDLKRIKGIGPKMEQLCNKLGFFHFDQIAAWTPDEVAWVDANLEGFRGRVTRDTWVEQAKLLASGAETEFSKRVDKGGVY